MARNSHPNPNPTAFSLRSPKASSLDSQRNPIKVGDTVNVTSGGKLTGTIKHMVKGVLWLHNNSYLKNSGLFVVKSESPA